MSTLRAVYTNIRAARTAIKDMGRLRQIATVMVRHGLGHVVEAWNLQDKAIVSLLVNRRADDADPLPLFERLPLALQDLGPTFVKLGQILSTRPDLIPQALCDELGALQDGVGPITLEAARDVLERSLGVPIEDVFDDFSPEPLASASIAQVHTATLKTGEEVVVKIQRPGIRATIESDLHLLFWVAKRIESTFPEARAFDPVAIAQEFYRAISKELDFTYEAQSLVRFARNFAEWDNIYIPTVYPAHSSTHVLVMERLRGVKITEAAPLGHDMDRIARECVAMIFKMVFEDGLFHGDLHPGNLFVLDDSRIGLIDFGLVGRMSTPSKDALADLLLNIAIQNYEGVARSLHDISIRNVKINYAAWEQDVVELMERHFSSGALADVAFGPVIRDLIEGAARHNVTIPPDYTMFFKAVMTVEGIGKIVSPDLDLLAECRPYVERVIAERYSPQRMMRLTANTLQSFGKFAQQFPVTANQFLAQIEDGHLAIGVELAQLSEMEAAHDRRQNRALIVAGAATLLVCGTLARGDQGLTLLGLPAVTTFCYGLGGYLGFRVLWKIILSGRW